MVPNIFKTLSKKDSLLTSTTGNKIINVVRSKHVAPVDMLDTDELDIHISSCKILLRMVAI